MLNNLSKTNLFINCKKDQWDIKYNYYLDLKSFLENCAREKGIIRPSVNSKPNSDENMKEIELKNKL